jgi:hypothetical protein
VIKLERDVVAAEHVMPRSGAAAGAGRVSGTPTRREIEEQIEGAARRACARELAADRPPERKEALKDAFKELMQEQLARLGGWTLGAIGTLVVSSLLFLVLYIARAEDRLDAAAPITTRRSRHAELPDHGADLRQLSDVAAAVIFIIAAIAGHLHGVKGVDGRRVCIDWYPPTFVGARSAMIGNDGGMIMLQTGVLGPILRSRTAGGR